MMLCNLPPWYLHSGATEGQPLAIQWSYDASYGSLRHVFTYKAAGGPSETSARPIEYRLLGHILLDAIPDEALGETLEALKGIWAYYLPAVPQPKLLPKHASSARIIRRVRPQYSIGDEF